MAREVRIAGLRTILAGGPDRSGGGDGPMLCLLHGFGANGDDLAGLWRVLDVPPTTRFAFPEAPETVPGYGYGSFCWWPIEIDRYLQRAARGDMEGFYQEEPAGLPAARQALQGFLAELEHQHQAPRSRLVLGGFSQGAMLATDLALQDQGEGPGLLGLCLLSGALINRPAWQRLLPGARGAPRFQSHGLIDEVLPFDAGRALHELLSSQQGGPFPGDLRRFYGGHTIPDGVLEDLGAWLTRLFAADVPGE